MFGGVQAVAWTDVKQMVLIVFGLVAVFVGLLFGMPVGSGLTDAFNFAGATGRLQTFDFSFDLTKQYTFWSGRSPRSSCSWRTSAPTRARCSAISPRSR